MSLGMLDVCSASNLERLSCPKSEGRDVHSSCPSPWGPGGEALLRTLAAPHLSWLGISLPCSPV